MNKSIKLVIILTIISLVSGGVLAGVYKFTAPKMKEVALEKQKRSVYEVLPNIESYREYKNDEKVLIFEGFDKNGDVSGIAYVAEGAGFQGVIRLMVGLDLDSKKVTGYKVLEYMETPGLGARITEDDFKLQFKGKSLGDTFKVNEDVTPVTGATISSKAVTKLIKKSADAVIKIYEG